MNATADPTDRPEPAASSLESAARRQQGRGETRFPDPRGPVPAPGRATVSYSPADGRHGWPRQRLEVLHPGLGRFRPRVHRIANLYPYDLALEIYNELRDPAEATPDWLVRALDLLYASRVTGTALGRYRERGLSLRQAFELLDPAEAEALVPFFPPRDETYAEREARLARAERRAPRPVRAEATGEAGRGADAREARA